MKPTIDPLTGLVTFAKRQESHGRGGGIVGGGEGGEGATDLSGLSDVALSSPANGQVLKYNGTNWVNDTDLTAEGGEGVTDHGMLTGLSDDDHTQYALANGSRGSFASTAQGTLADSAVQPEDLATVAISGSYTDLTDKPTIPDTYDDIGAAAAVHTHDDRYFTEAETTTLLAGKSDTTHNHDADYAAIDHDHTAADVTDFDTEVSNNADVAANTTARHSHSNKALLDTYTQTETDLADAVSKKHAHSNSAVLDATTASFTTAKDTKLSGIATGATANDTDANLKARGNHTGTQTASTISDFNTAADARITAATGVSVQAYSANTTTLGNTTTGTGSIVRATSPALTTPTGIVKSDVGLGNVDNTSDATKNSAAVTLTNKTISGSSNTLTDIPATALSTSAITLGYAQITSDFTTTTTPGIVDVTGLSVTVTVPAGGRRIRITAFAKSFKTSNATASTSIYGYIRESTTTLTIIERTSGGANFQNDFTMSYTVAASSGSHTYKVSASQGAAGTLNVSAAATYPAYILVEAI